MTDPGRLAISVRDGRGHSTRLSYDEVTAGNLLQDLSFSSSAPGGHKAASFSLLRDLFPRLDEAPFNRVSIYGPGGVEVWGGRVATLPRQTGTNFSLSPSCVGMQAHMTDDTSFMEVYVDRDASSWSEPPLTRRAVLAAGTNQSGTNGLTSSIGGGGLSWEIGTTVAAGAISELWYTCPGSIRSQTVLYAGLRVGNFTGLEPATLFGFDTDAGDGGIGTTDSFSPFTSSHGVTLASPKKHLMIRVYNPTTSPISPGSGVQSQIAPLAVYGTSGVGIYFISGNQPYGVKADEVVANVITRAAPLLKFTTGAGGTIQPTGNMVIPHLVFKEPSTAADVIQAVNRFYGWDWLVWGDEFYYQPPGSGTVWRTRRAAGGSLSSEGPSADGAYNGARVTFTDVIDGETKIVGPPGSGYEYENANLVDTSEANPVNDAGIPRRWLPVDVTGVGMTSATVAIELGRLQLAEANATKRAGTVTVQGTVEHPSGQMVPVSEIRAGDTIVFSDLVGYEPQRIDEVSYQHGTRTATLGINEPLKRSESLLERLTLSTSLVN